MKIALRTGIAGIVIAVIAALPVLLYRSRLPNPMATHWDYSGRPDGSAHPITFVVGTIVLVLVLTAIAALVAIRGNLAIRRARVTYSMIWGFTAGVVISLQCVAVWANLDRPDWTGARSLNGGLAIIFASGVVLAGVAALLGRIGPDATPPRPANGTVPALQLDPGQRAVWVSTARNQAMITVSTTMFAAGVILLALAILVTSAAAFVPVGSILTGVGLFMLAWCRVRVIVDERGMRVALGLGWPGWTFARSDITDARVEDRRAMAYGGWGYRGTSRGAPTLMIRSGECLVIELAGGRTFAVSVDDAAAGAALLNRLRTEPVPQSA